MSPVTLPYDALLLVSFGGPEKRDDVLPFLENVLRRQECSRPARARGRRALLPLRRRQPDQCAESQPVGLAGRGTQPAWAAAGGLLGQSQLASLAARRAGARWPTTASSGPWPSSLRPSAATPAAGNTWKTSLGPARRSARRHRRWTNSACSTITRGLSRLRPTAWPRPSAAFPPTAAPPPG